MKLNKTIIIFGFTGNLAKSQMIPSINNLIKKDLVQHNITVIGIGRHDESTIQNPFVSEINFVYCKISSLNELKSFLYIREKIAVKTDNLLIYVATPPSFINVILKMLLESGIVKQFKTKIFIEKPFGTSHKNTKQIKEYINSNLANVGVFLIDHYLSKPAYREIATNSDESLENILNKNFVESVHIWSTESKSIGSRSSFFDQTGQLADLAQGHMIQMMCMLTMSKDQKIEERLRRLDVLKDASLDEENFCFGQYDGYLKEENIPKTSTTNTLAAFRMFVDSKRWKGVPFIFFTGKCLKKKISQIFIKLKNRPGFLTNEIIVIQQNPEIKISKYIGENRVEHKIKNIKTTLSDYEIIFKSIINDEDQTFVDPDEAIMSWEILSPIIKHQNKLLKYSVGSWGPDEVKKVVGEDFDCISTL